MTLTFFILQAVTFFDAFIQEGREELKYFNFVKIYIFKTVKCLQCNTEYLTESQCLSHLTVDLTNPLGDAVNNFLQTKSKTTGCCYVCHRHARGATCTLTAYELPLEIQTHILGFPRFINVLLKRSIISATGRRVKDRRPITLSEFDLDGVNYYPLAGFAHIGASLNSGHFVAYLNRDSSWYSISDSSEPREVMGEPVDWLLVTFCRGHNYAKGPSGPHVYDY